MQVQESLFVFLLILFCLFSIISLLLIWFNKQDIMQRQIWTYFWIKAFSLWPKPPLLQTRTDTWLPNFCVKENRLKVPRSLVACTRLYNPLCPLVGRSVVWSVTFYFFMTSLLLPKWFSDLKYGPYPPARNFGSRVSGLVLLLRLNASSLLINNFLFLCTKLNYVLN